MNVLQETHLKLLAVDCLRALKARRTFRALSRETGLPSGVLSRYVSGSVLPKAERAEQIVRNFYNSHIDRLVSECAAPGPGKYIVTADLNSQPFLLSIISHRAAGMFEKPVHKVFTSAVDGIPIAIAMAAALGTRSIFAKRTQELAFSDYYVSKSSGSRPLFSPLYLPKNLLRKNESVLIVDDVIRGGATFDALLSICSQAKARIAGVFAMFITRRAYRSIKGKFKVGYAQLVDG